MDSHWLIVFSASESWKIGSKYLRYSMENHLDSRIINIARVMRE